MKKHYWITDKGILIASEAQITIANGTKISRHIYYKLKNKRK